VYPELAIGPGAGVPTHLVLLVLAGLVSASLIVYRATTIERLPVGKVLAALAIIAVAALAGGRAHFIWNAWSLRIDSRPAAILRFWEGLHAPGALVAIAVATPLVLRLFRIPVARFLDGFVPSACVGIALARLGCFASGCCFGRLCAWGFCLAFPPGSPAQRLHLRSGAISHAAEWSAAIHPFPLYLAAIALGAAAIGFGWRARRKYAGQAALFSATAYLVTAGLIEPLRENYYPRDYTWVGTLQFEWLGLGMAAAAILGLLVVETRHRLWTHTAAALRTHGFAGAIGTDRERTPS
jgi:phosphatidylglycerol:prolipoprotein diacylglycerol transferase